jgi:hypothetical protein
MLAWPSIMPIRTLPTVVVSQQGNVGDYEEDAEEDIAEEGKQ